MAYTVLMSATASSVISTSPDVMSGSPVFAGTRVPVQTLFDYLAAGDPLEEFLEDFPSVGIERVRQLLNEAARGHHADGIPSEPRP